MTPANGLSKYIESISLIDSINKNDTILLKNGQHAKVIRKFSRGLKTLVRTSKGDFSEAYIEKVVCPLELTDCWSDYRNC